MTASASHARRKRGAGATRNPHRTQERILAAALLEFAQKGLAGARVDVIARRAGVNKRMLYHYFASKQGLFSAVLRRKLTQREDLLASAPAEPSETLVYWYDAACRDANWFRLLGWEALQEADQPLVYELHRRAISRRAVANIRDRQRHGLLPAHLDPKHLLLSLMALTAYPLILPQVTRLVTGRSVTDPVFQCQRRKFLKQIGQWLHSGPPSLPHPS